MRLQNLLLIPGLTGILLAGCKEKPATSNTGNKADSTFIYIAALEVEQLKLTNSFFEDPKVTAAIKEYEKAATLADKIRVFNSFESLTREPKTAVTTDLPACKQQGLEFLTYIDKISPDQFDLAIRNNDLVAQQVKLVNRYFNDLDNQTLNAIAVYEKLSAEEKKNILSNPAKYIPNPDYVERIYGREFQRQYYFRQLQLLWQLTRYLRLTRYINEFPQGFTKLNTPELAIDERQFDLHLSKN